MSIAGEGKGVEIKITESYGMFRVIFDDGGNLKICQGASLDAALGRAAGEGAPDSYILHTSSILRGIMAKAMR